MGSHLQIKETNLPPIRALIFDMDGLLLNTEAIYISCIEKVLNAHVPPPSSTTAPARIKLPASLLSRVQGRPAPIAHGLILDWAAVPGLSAETYFADLKVLEALHFPEARPLPGVEALLRAVSEDAAMTGSRGKRVEIGLATSSHSEPFKWKTSHLEESVFRHFPIMHRILGDDPRIPKGRGKPNPDIYLLALEAINSSRAAEVGGDWEEIRPDECLVLEDGVVGVEAGRRAGMQVCWVPDRGIREVFRGREESVLRGGVVEGEKMSDEAGNGIQYLNGAEVESWGIVLDSLEEFPYERYNIVVSSAGLLKSR